MAKYNELLVGRYNRYLQKLLSMKGPASLESLNPELQATLETFHGVENRYLEGWDRFGQAQVVAAIVANPSAFRLRNPVGSNVIAVVEAIEVSTTGPAAQFTVATQLTLTDQVNSNTPANLDGRQRPLTSLKATNGSAQIGGLVRIALLATNVAYSFITTVNQEINITPGYAVEVQSNLSNQSFACGVIWRERYLEDSERS